MTDDYTHSLLFDQWEEEDEYRWCDNPDCIFHDPIHTPDECITAEQAEQYFKDQMKDTEEYKLALSDVMELIDGELAFIPPGPWGKGAIHAFNKIKKRINKEMSNARTNRI